MHPMHPMQPYINLYIFLIQVYASYASMHPMQMIKLVFNSNGLISCLVSVLMLHYRLVPAPPPFYFRGFTSFEWRTQGQGNTERDDFVAEHNPWIVRCKHPCKAGLSNQCTPTQNQISEDTSSILITGRIFRISERGGGWTTKEVQKFKESCKLEFFSPYMHVNSFI